MTLKPGLRMADGPKNVKSRISPLLPKFVYSSGRWVAKLVARQLAAAALWGSNTDISQN
jgi:hypothetical protein